MFSFAAYDDRLERMLRRRRIPRAMRKRPIPATMRAMLTVVITVVFFVCYCCHRNIKKQSNSAYRQQWLEQEANMEIYSVEQCTVPGLSDNYLDATTGNEYQPLPAVMAVNHCHSAAMYHHHHHPTSAGGPPPSYDTVLAQDKMQAEVAAQWKELGLSYPTKTIGQKPLELLEPTEFTDIREATDCHNCCQLSVGGAGATASLQVFCRNCGQFVDVTDHDPNNNRNCCSPTPEVRNLVQNDDNGNLMSNPEASLELPEDPNNNNSNEIQEGDYARQDEENNNNNNGEGEVLSGATDHASNPAVTPGGSSESGSSAGGDSTIRNLNENGIVRLDMSRIIDQTGLPTYEAALKLESSGYV